MCILINFGVVLLLIFKPNYSGFEMQLQSNSVSDVFSEQTNTKPPTHKTLFPDPPTSMRISDHRVQQTTLKIQGEHVADVSQAKQEILDYIYRDVIF